MTLKIDAFNHILPKPFFEKFAEVTVNKGAIKRWLHIPFLHDTDVRFRMLDEFGDSYRQILSLSSPPLESINPDRQITLDMCRLANDSMADLVRKYPSRFPGFLASLAMNHPDAAIRELERSATERGALGVQIFSNVNGLPLDDPQFFGVFEAADRLGIPIFLHPARAASHADYRDEQKSKYEIWWTLGWPYETSAAMHRLVFSGLLDRLPNIKNSRPSSRCDDPLFRGADGSRTGSARLPHLR